MMFCATLFLASCGYRAIPMAKNDVEASVAEITNQYKRRADLIPNLLEVVKGYAKHEAQTLESVVAARAKATQVTLDPTKLSTEKLKEFQTSQGELSQALGRLMVIAEQYPDLKANQNFRDLQVQLEGSENRITVARNRYIDAIRRFNNLVTVAPQSWTNSLIFHFEKMPQWNVTEEEQKKNEQPPQVKF
jgi:LemA protein